MSGKLSDFISPTLQDFESAVLADFNARRKLFDEFLATQGSIRVPCPSCGYPTIDDRGQYDICSVCHWEDDGQDDATADEVWGGPNSDLSLTESRLRIGTFLCELAQRLRGSINLDPMEILQAVREREEVLHRFRSRHIRRDTRKNDPVWRRYSALQRDTLVYLIKRDGI
jgi:hypothetical protein